MVLRRDPDRHSGRVAVVAPHPLRDHRLAAVDGPAAWIATGCDDQLSQVAGVRSGDVVADGGALG